MSATTHEVPVIDAHEFRQAMGSFASGVNVITVRDPGGRPHGMTATAFCSVSMEPPLVLICVNRDTRTHDLIVESGRFGVSMLSGGSTEVSNHCARPGADKRLPEEWLVEDTWARTPVLSSSLVHADCSVHERQEAGTHAVFIGRVEHVHFGEDGDPLLHFKGSYCKLVADA